MKSQICPLVVLLCVALVQCYPGGAPSCKSDVPSHDKIKAKSGKSPFEVVASPAKSLPNGDKVVTVSITATKGLTFKGFHLIARVPHSTANIGKFTAAADSKILKCNTSSNVITHKDNSNKSSVSFTWTAPKKFKGKVEFKATIVKEFKEFYTNVRSSQVTIN